MNTIPPADFSYFEMLNEAVQMHAADVMDPEIAGRLAAIGIVKGKPFNPDARMKKILGEALAVGNAAMRAMSIGGRPSEGFGYYGTDSQWINGLWVGGHEFMTPPAEITKEGVVEPYPSDGARKLNARAWFFYSVTGITPAMAMRLPNVGSQYLENFRGQPGQFVRWQQDLQGHPACQYSCRPVLVVHHLRQSVALDARHPATLIHAPAARRYPSPAATANA